MTIAAPTTAEEIRQQVDAAVLLEMSTPEYQRALKKMEGRAEFVREDSPSYDDLKKILEDEYVGLARLFCRHHAGKFVFEHGIDRWFRCNCTHWEQDTGKHQLKAVVEIAEPFEAQADFFTAASKEHFNEAARLSNSADKDDRDLSKEHAAKAKGLKKTASSWEGAAKKCKDPTSIKKVLEMASAGDDSLGITGQRWNKYPNLFACANTLVDLETGKEHKPDPNLYINQHSPVVWGGLHAESDLWDTFLDQVFCGKQYVIDAMQECVGYWMTGHNSIQEFYCLLGPQGRNGKGVLFRTLRAMMGNYYVSIDPRMLMDNGFQRSGTGPSPELVNLRDKRLAVASESKKGATFSMDEIKRWTGGDPITCRGMQSDNIIEYVPRFKPLFVTNRMPKSNDPSDKAFEARLRLYECLARFTSNMSEVDPLRHIYPMDPMLEFKLHTPEVLAAVMAWGARGAIRLFRNNMVISHPPEVLVAGKDFMLDQDLVGQFIRQCLEITDGSERRKTSAKTTYLSFKRWCIEEQCMTEKYVMTLQSFGADFKNRAEIQRVPPVNVVNYNVVVHPDWLPND